MSEIRRPVAAGHVHQETLPGGPASATPVSVGHDVRQLRLDADAGTRSGGDVSVITIDTGTDLQDTLPGGPASATEFGTATDLAPLMVAPRMQNLRPRDAKPLVARTTAVG